MVMMDETIIKSWEWKSQTNIRTKTNWNLTIFKSMRRSMTIVEDEMDEILNERGMTEYEEEREWHIGINV